MAIEETLDRLVTNVALLTGAMATLAESVNGKYTGKPIYAQDAAAAPTAAATPKPRGRPARGEATSTATVAAGSTAAQSSAPVTAEADPFAEPASVPAATLDEVRAALTALKNAKSQAEALKTLKDSSGVDNLGDLQKTPEKYGLVVAAAKAAMLKAETVAEPDPFEIVVTPNTEEPPAKPPTVEDVKAACVAAGKRTGQDKVQKIVMEHGGKGKNAATGVEGPSLSALPAAQYAAVIAAIAALPTTK